MPLFEINDYLNNKNRNRIRKTPEEEALELINQEIKDDEDYMEVVDLDKKLETYKAKFLEFQKDVEGNIDLVGLKRMLEELGQPKTHLELKRMIKEIDKTNRGTICYRDFIAMMCGPKTSVLKLILKFEGKSNAPKVTRPEGPAPKRDLSSLP